MTKKSAADWKRIELDYRAGLPFRELSAKYGVSVGGISKRAKAGEWVREGDGSSAGEEVSAEPVNTKVNAEKVNTEVNRKVNAEDERSLSHELNPAGSGINSSAAVASTDTSSNSSGLTDKQSKFVDEYLLDLNATQAAIRAGYSAKTAGQVGNENLKKPEIAAVIAKRMKDREARTEVTQDMVLRRWWEIANADSNELIQFRRVCCRRCHGDGHAYQWVDELEYESKLAESSNDSFISDEGGFGFSPARDPHPDCPSCYGEGRGEVYANDTRKLSGGARLLYDGLKKTKDGFEIKMQDRSRALESVARHLGMFKDKSNPAKDGGETPEKSTPLSSNDVARRIAFILAKGMKDKGASDA